MIALLLAATALAGGPWSGISADGIAGLGPVVYLSPEAGWAAPVEAGEGGDVRVFVGHDDAEASLWLAAQRSLRSWTVPEWPLGDEAWGNGYSLLGFRDRNVAVVVVMDAGGASSVAENLMEHLAPDSPWPTSPTVTVEGEVVRVDGEWAYVSFRPAPVLDPATLLPREVHVTPIGAGAARLDVKAKRIDVTAWDRFGRSATATWPTP